MNKKHEYKASILWPVAQGGSTKDYKSYSRNHIVSIEGKPTILASSDVAFRGDMERHNPEDLFLSSIASCHMLWYLHFCATSGIEVLNYTDTAYGVMEEEKNGSGKFTTVILNPIVTVSDISIKEKAIKLHHKANEYCFIANSCNFIIEHKPIIKIKEIE